MKQAIGVLSAAALALGVFLATNAALPENNSELSLSSLTNLTSANAECFNGLARTKWVPKLGLCDGSEGETYTCITGWEEVPDPIANNGVCINGTLCWTGEGGNGYPCYQ